MEGYMYIQSWRKKGTLIWFSVIPSINIEGGIVKHSLYCYLIWIQLYIICGLKHPTLLWLWSNYIMLLLAWSLIFLCIQNLCIKITLACDHNLMNYFKCLSLLSEVMITRLKRLSIGRNHQLKHRNNLSFTSTRLPWHRSK